MEGVPASILQSAQNVTVKLLSITGLYRGGGGGGVE